MIIWYLYEVFLNYITDKSYNDFSEITQYLKPTYSNTKYEEITQVSPKQPKQSEHKTDPDPDSKKEEEKRREGLHH